MNEPYKINAVYLILTDIEEACGVSVKFDPELPEGVSLEDNNQPCLMMAYAVLSALTQYQQTKDGEKLYAPSPTTRQ